MPTEMEQLLKAKDVAQRMQVHPQTVIRWAKSGRIAHVVLPTGGYRFDPRVVDEMVGAA